PGKLAVSYIHGIHFRGTVLEHTVGEPTCGCTDIHTDLAIRAERKHLHGLFQLEAAAADVTNVVATDFYLCAFRDELPCLVSLLPVDENNAGHNERFCPLTTLGKAFLAKILIQTHFHAQFSLS